MSAYTLHATLDCATLPAMKAAQYTLVPPKVRHRMHT